MNQIRVGILGCANIARRSLIPAFSSHPAFAISALASRSTEKAAPLAEQYGMDCCGYDDLVNRDDVDLIYCPLPTGLHYEWVGRALSSGKHVLCEKSLACSDTEVSELVEKARTGHLFLMESFQFRFHAQNLFVRKVIESGKLGTIRSVTVKFGFPPFPDGSSNIRYSRELGGGALLDAGAYTLKAAAYLLGRDLSVVAGSAWSEGREVDLGGSLMLRTSNGVVVHTSYGFDNFYQCGYEIWGSKGRLTTTRAFTARSDHDAEVILETSEGQEVKLFRDDHFARLLDYVAQSISLGDFDDEYDECLTQARLISSAAKSMGCAK